MGYPVKPSGYVGWGSTGMTNSAEPTDAKKAYGWAVNEQPPSSYFNWLQAKQDEWLQYLNWRTRLVPLIEDSFNYGTQGGYNTSTAKHRPSGLSPVWENSPSAVSAINGNLVIGSNGGGYSGLEYLQRYVQAPTGGFLLETEAKYYDDLSGRSGLARVGIFGVVEFMATGVTGFWGLHYVASGRAATSIGCSAPTASGLVAMSVIARGPTMVIEKNGQQIYALPYQPVNPSSSPLYAGARVQMYGANGDQAEFSFLRLYKDPR